MVTPAAKQKAVAHLCDEHQVSQRRACNVLQVDRSTVRYQSRNIDDGELRETIKRVSRERRRFGYRRIHVMVEREGYMVNYKKLRRIYREETLQVRRRGGRKRALGTRKPMVLPDGPNQRWSLDFVSDAFTDGRRFRILTVVDDFTRENLALIADTSLSGQRVTRELDQVIVERAMPGTIVSERAFVRHWSEDNGERHRVHQHGHPKVGSGYRHRLALHRARKANPKRIHRKLQRQAARRMLKRNAVQLAGRCQRNAGSMAGGLQPPQATFIARKSDAVGIRKENECGQTGRIKRSNQTQGLSMWWRKIAAQVRR